jgi:predicted ribosome quality control (RQC) complex YloA/Tae2 family protein
MEKSNKFREKILESGKKLILGKDKESNESLVRKFRGKSNTILHTSSPGSPFGVIDKVKPSKEEVMLSGAVVARYSQDWRDNKKDVKVNIFTGKDVYKLKGMPMGTFGVKKSKMIIVKRGDILKLT